MEIDYYELLEISKSAGKDEIKKAYRKMALKFHPDRNQGDAEAEAKFKLINEAYQILSDDEKRTLYDKYGREGLKNMASRGGFDFNFDFVDDLFSNFFGGFGRRQSSEKFQADLVVELDLSFKEAVFGCKKELKFRYKKSCEKCNGSGAKDGEMKTCTKCGGKGQVGAQRGFMTFIQTCAECNGSGSIVKDKCAECKGKGFSECDESVEVSVPEGIDDGMSLRVNGKGNELKNGRGNLLVQVSVATDTLFVRDDMDVYIEFPVFFTQAALGERIKVPTLRGHSFINLPLGAKDKQRFVLENEGVKDVRSARKGRQIVQIAVKFPKNLNDEQKDLLKKLSESFGVSEDGFEEQKGILDKIADWFKGE